MKDYSMKSFIIVSVIMLIFVSCNQKNTDDKKSPPPPPIIQDTGIQDITFNPVVDKGTFNYTLTNGNSGISTVKYLVVDKNSTQDEVKKLANKLWNEYQSSDLISIAILTSIEAAQNYENWDYDLSNSWLLLINKNFKNNEIQYQPAFYKLRLK